MLAAASVVALCFVAVPAGILLWRQVFETLPSDGLRTLRLVHEQILTEHVEPQDAEDLIDDAIRGMVGELDRFSEFVPADDVEGFEARELEGTYVGVGVLLFSGVSPATVQSPLAGGSAAELGVLPGDRLIRIGDEDVSDLPAAEATETAVRLLRGEAGSSIAIQIERSLDDEPSERLELELERRAVPQSRVKWAHLADPEQRIGYIHVSGFQRGMVEDFDARLSELEADGPLAGLCLDLRHNPGGLLTEAVALANRFVAEGELVTLKRRRGEVLERHEADRDACTHPELPLVVLVDEGTASASEVVTGALQDLGRALVVGTRSYGKGVVQSIYSWSGLPFRLKLTTARYYTPSGRSLERTLRHPDDGDDEGGIVPDEIVALGADDTRRLAARLAAHEIRPPYLERARLVADQLERPLALAPSPADDPQLAAALAALALRAQPTAGNRR
jgi:carboxyl-terminal processing protease